MQRYGQQFLQEQSYTHACTSHLKIFATTSYCAQRESKLKGTGQVGLQKDTSALQPVTQKHYRKINKITFN